MLRRRNKTIETEAFYIDTNIALDYITRRNPKAISVLDNLKAEGATIVSSSLLVMEAADFRKDSTYFVQKVTKAKWAIRKIMRQAYEKDLDEGDFDGVSEWIEELRSKLDIILYDFLVDTDTWELAQYISQSSNLAAPDVIHLSSAIIATQSGIDTGGGFVLQCNVFISNDRFLKKEAEKIKEQLGVSYPDIMTLSETENEYFKKPKQERGKRNTKIKA